MCPRDEDVPGGNTPPAWMLRIWPVAMLPLLASAATRGLWAPDEPRYAQVAREIFRGGDALVMHLCGAVYPDKPPMLFWLSGLFGSLGGWSELALRMPNLLAVAATAWLTQRFARAWWSRREAVWAPIVFLTMFLPAWLGGRLQVDPLLLFFCTAALYAASGGGRGRPVSVGRMALAGLCLGFGALTKGPVAWSNAGLVLLVWLFLRKRLGGERRPWRRSLPGLAVLVVLAAAPVVIWALLAIDREPLLRQRLLYGEHLARVTSARNHEGPFWQPLLDLLANAMPWTIPVVWMIVAAIRRRRERPVDTGVWRAASWLLVLLAFFSAVATKRELYLLPAYPAAALLVARWIAARETGRPAGGGFLWMTVPVAVVFVLIGAGGMLVFAFESRIPESVGEISGLAWRGIGFGLPVLVLGALAVRAAVRRRIGAWAAYQAATFAAALTLAALLAFPVVDRVKCGRGLAEILAARPERPSIVPCFGVSPETFRFYSGRPAVKARPETAWASEGDAFLALVSRKRFDDLPAEMQEGVVVLETRRVGSRTVLLLGRRRN